MKSTPVAYPPLEEQRNIVAYVHKLSSTYAELSGCCEIAIAKLQERRTALISAAVTGQIDVRHLATADAA